MTGGSFGVMEVNFFSPQRTRISSRCHIRGCHRQGCWISAIWMAITMQAVLRNCSSMLLQRNRQFCTPLFCSSFVPVQRPTTPVRRHPSLYPSTAFPRPFHSTALYMNKKRPQWSVGDAVVTTTTTAPSSIPEPGEVVAVRGAGWYSVKLSNTQQIVKVRSSQLQLVAEETIEKSIINKNTNDVSNHNSNVGNNNALYRVGPTLEADPGRPPQFPPPPPTIHDLDALVKHTTFDSSSSPVEEDFLQQVAHHAQYDRWVVFTDLHCSPVTLNTTLQVLETVHDTALQRQAGVLFLGDFWHHRGTLRVDCLNAVLKALENWRVPMIMIPGNHDQVTLDGHDHGLTPLGNAYRVGTDDESVAGPLILSYPTVFRKGLFVPHIRDTATMESVLQSQHAKDATALFVHAEVKGALMNDLLISTHGIPPSSFPSDKSIYSGHFHKPHVVHSSSSRHMGREEGSGTVTVEYLGSPYEISLAEAEQEKQLVVLDEHWQCIERIPLILGRRHFKVSSWEELSRLQLSQGNMAADDGGNKKVKRGDRVVVTLPSQRRETPENSDENTFLNDHVQALRKNGVMVEVREDNTRPFPTMLPRNPLDDVAPEAMTAESIWRAYLKDAEMRESIDEEVTESLLRSGLEILEEIDRDGTDSNQEQQFDLRLNQLTVHGFGPFRDSVTYPLDNRGLVLLRGSNSQSGPDSNGSGKSSLAMATLWALTGTLDARRSVDMKVADVVNDDSKTARVTVEGLINEVPFVVSRTKAASRGDLFFQLDGVDMTTQSIKETQVLLEERLGVDPDILLRSIFHGQHGMNDLLEATDAKLKEELSLVVPVDVWQSAAVVARSKMRDAKKRSDELEGMRRLRAGDIENLKAKIDHASETRESWLARFVEAKFYLESLNTKYESKLSDGESAKKVQGRLKTLAQEIQIQSSQLDERAKEREHEMAPFQQKLEEAMLAKDAASQLHTELDTRVATSQVKFSTATVGVKNLEEKWSLDLAKGIPAEFVPPDNCPTCLQPLSFKGTHHDQSNIEDTIRKEVESALQTMLSAEAELRDAESQLAHSLTVLESHDTTIEALRSDISDHTHLWDTTVKIERDELEKKRKLQNELTAQLSSLVEESQLISEKDAATARFNMEQLSLQHASDLVKGLEDELKGAVDMQKGIVAEQKEQDAKRRLLSDVAERCGQRGVQAFILQNVVQSLELTAQRYLDYLSEGGQRLELSLDAGEKILRVAYVRGPDGDFKQRPLSTLSGGQWRRCSLALSFAFAELIARRGRLKSSLLVLDEPLTHLDRSGRTNFGEVVRKLIKGGSSEGVPLLSGLQFSTVILILQDLAAEELEEAFDRMDTVVRENGGSYVRVDEGES